MKETLLFLNFNTLTKKPANPSSFSGYKRFCGGYKGVSGHIKNWE